MFYIQTKIKSTFIKFILIFISCDQHVMNSYYSIVLNVFKINKT